MYRGKIKVLVVDDSLLFRKVLVSELSKDPMIEVVGTAADAYEARDKIIEFIPDVITLDINMPKMDGIEFTRKLMAQYPLPIVIVSSHAETKKEAFDSGAIYFVNKPDINSQNSLSTFIESLLIKIKLASRRKSEEEIVEQAVETKRTSAESHDFDTSKIVAIGASTGGVDALYTVLLNLPSNFPPVVITQHIPPKFSTLLAERLDKATKLNVVEGVDGEVLAVGKAIIAPGDKHMKIQKRGGNYVVRILDEDKVNGHRPSCDVLFNSVAEVCGKEAVGVILTGMGKDGAKGLLNMRNAGAYTFGQDKETSVVYGMPMEAYNIGAVCEQLPLEKISINLMNKLKVK